VASCRDIIRWWCASYRYYKLYIILQIKNNFVRLAVWHFLYLLLVLSLTNPTLESIFSFCYKPKLEGALSSFHHCLFNILAATLNILCHPLDNTPHWISSWNECYLAICENKFTIWWPHIAIQRIHSHNPHVKYSNLPQHHNLLLKLGMCLLLLAKTQMHLTYPL
jgi:hypothetical protein